MNTQVAKEPEHAQNKGPLSKVQSKKLILVASHLAVLALGSVSGYFWV
ncbi:MAG: hypothetical protein IPO31_05280 [Candidatus Obscuribacter sp.]|nr:hypothetical protein [Candidatus Obscuribacter sp.]